MANRNDIPIGRCNAISREELARIWGMSDRATRHTIAELRALPGDDGYAILSTATKPSGYWRSDDPAEIAAFMQMISSDINERRHSIQCCVKVSTKCLPVFASIPQGVNT